MIHRLRLGFTDTTGVVIPSSAMRTSFVTNAPGNHPVTLPSSPPIPIPDSLPFYGTPISPTAGRFPVVLDFDCGVLPTGVLTVEADAEDEDGRIESARATVRIGR